MNQEGSKVRCVSARSSTSQHMACIDTCPSWYLRFWIVRGCYGFAPNVAKGWIVPCPSYAICTHLKKMNGDPFCVPPPADAGIPGARSGDTSKIIVPP